jgi:hypothetical protein
MSGANFINDDFITPYEAEHLIQELVEIDIKEYGSKQWFKQHETMDRLNIQAHKNAIGSTDEFVMEAFVTNEKMELLISDLLTAETWKLKVFPLLSKEVAQLSSIKSYMCMYHEASICNLLEVMLYHKTACDSSEDALVEVIDYCYRKFLILNSKAEAMANARHEPAEAKDPMALLSMTPDEELKKQSDEIEFSCSIIAFSIIRFITDQLHELAVPIVHQLMEISDMPCVLVPLIELKPWLRKNSKGEIEKFEDQKWQVVPKNETNKITKVEA